MTKARRGYNAGGRCYGYDNVEIREGGAEGRRVRVEYAINAEQAAVVREIFARYAEGWGLKRLVKDLNARRIAPPSAGKRGTGSWSPSAIHAMLRRDRYRGTLIWGRLAKGYKRGTKVRTARPAAEWLHVDAPHLQIIDDALWLRVQSRLGTNRRHVGGKQLGSGRPPQYLLSGLARCGQCGGPIAVNHGKSARHPVKVYLCQYHRTRGDEVCSSSLRRPVDAVDAALLNHLKENVLTEQVITDALKILRCRLIDRTRTAAADLKPLELESKQLRGEIDRLVAAIASGAPERPSAIVQAVAERQERLDALDARIRAIKSAPEAISTELRRLEREARARLADLHTTLRAHPAEARAFLGRLFSGPLKFTPEGNRYLIEGEIPLAAAISAGVPNSASPGGFEPPLAT